MALLIKADGTSQDVQVPTENRLEFYQKAVGCYIEKVNLPQQATHCMLVNEEGLLNSLPINNRASQLADRHIVGDVLIVKTPEEFD